MSDALRSLTLADAAIIDALPAHIRAAIMALARRSFFAGWDMAKDCAESDARQGMNWMGVPETSISAAWDFLTREAEPLLHVSTSLAADELKIVEPKGRAA